MRTLNSKRLLLFLIGIGVALLIVAAGACGDASDDSDGAAGNPSTGEEERVVGDSSGGEAPESSAGGAPAARPADGAPDADPQFQQLLDRKIVQDTSVDLGVEEVGRSFQDIIRIAGAAGGFVASSSFSNVDDEQVADLTVRVPAERYQDVLAQVRGLGEVAQEGTSASDVTEEYTDLGARLRTLRATEERYLDLLARASTINDILVVQDRLDAVRGEIEQVQGRINVLDHLTELATITVHLRPLEAIGAGGGGLQPLEVAAEAWERSLDALEGLAAGALAVIAFSWWLVPPLVAAGLAARWWRDRRPKPTQTSV